MSKCKQSKRIFLLIISFLITTLAPLILTNSVRAEEAEAITPDLGLDYFLLLEDQSVTSSTTQLLPFDFHTIWVVSIGNNTLSARLSISETEAIGLWWVSIIGTGGKYWFDYTFGIVPVSGSTAIIDINEVLSFGLATGGIILTSPVSIEDPVRYRITVTGAMTEGR